MRKEIIDAIRKTRGGTSFVELENIPGSVGEKALFAAENLVIWLGLSEKFVDSFNGLFRDGMIDIKPTSTLVYMIDGKALSIPLAKRIKPYKNLRWLPVVINLSKKCQDSAESQGPSL